jgi:hypothetical protein
MGFGHFAGFSKIARIGKPGILRGFRAWYSLFCRAVWVCSLMVSFDEYKGGSWQLSDALRSKRLPGFALLGYRIERKKEGGQTIKKNGRALCENCNRVLAEKTK